ncbi:MAG: cytochrome c biogenesis protein CcsA [Thioalkalispiraceae bacterium]|jgi:ABC-type uncharacterized transport system permease subunit
MDTSLISIAAIIIYLVSGSLLWLGLQDKAKSLAKSRILLLATLATLLHLGVIYQHTFTTQGIDIGFFNIISLVGGLIALLLIIASLKQPVECLGIIVFPVAALSLGLRKLDPEAYYLTQNLPGGLEFHILVSILAYSLLSIAVVQAILLYLQESHLRNRHPGGFIRSLPPLETMESLLFSMIGLGFIILTISLISGLFYLDDILAQHLVHKTVLSFGAWLLFGILLWGRYQFGWRGRTAIRWTVSGFTLLVLAYFGSKFVIELVLAR